MGRWGSFWKPGQALPRLVDTAAPASAYMGMAGAYGSEVPPPFPDESPRREHRDNRPRHFPTTPGGDRGRPRQPHITPPEEPRLPDVPEGTLLRLDPGEWTHWAGAHPGEEVVVRVSAVHPDVPRPNSAVVWVSGHGVECSSMCGTPCRELLVSVEALWRAVGGR